MAQVTFNTDSIIKFLLIAFAIIGIIVVGCIGVFWLANSIASSNNFGQATVVSTPVASPTYPSVLTCTILSTTTSNGHYQALTTTGTVLYFPDFTSWNRMQPRATYTLSLTGYDGFAYYVGDINMISRPMEYDRHYNDRVYSTNYPNYYYYLGQYYQCDGIRCDNIPYKSAVNENVRRERPPYGMNYDNTRAYR